MQVDRLVLEVTQTSAESGIRVPAELTMLGKTLLTSIRSAARLLKSLSPGDLFSGVLELKDLLARLNRIIDAIWKNEMKIFVDATARHDFFPRSRRWPESPF